MAPKTALVTGANGFIGSAVCRAFSQAGYATYGLMRSDRTADDLAREEIVPIIGSAADAEGVLSALPPVVDVIVSCSEDLYNYEAHFNDVLAMIKQICKSSLQAAAPGGTKPLVIFSSGCKDYGTTPLYGDPALAPHTEDSPLNPPAILVKRTESALHMFTYTDLFDCVVTRPTTLYGRSGSYYSCLFEKAEHAKTQSEGVLTIEGYPNSILHGTHVDDVASAYLAFATAPRQVVAGQVYNISSHRFETLSEIVPVVEKSHGIKIRLVDPPPGERSLANLDLFFFNFPQWVGSEKLRKHTGWVDRKPLFHEGYDLYRMAYEIAAKDKSEQYQRIVRRGQGKA